MPGPKGEEWGIRNPLNLRAAVDLPQFKGMNLQSDPGMISDDQFQLLENVRLGVGAGIRPRPGLSAKNDTNLDGCVIGIWDDRGLESGLRFVFVGYYGVIL